MKEEITNKMWGIFDEGSSRIALGKALRVNNSCPLIDVMREVMFGDGFFTGQGSRLPLEICEAALRATMSGEQEISCERALEAIRKLSPQKFGPDLREIAPIAQAEGLPLYVAATTQDTQAEGYLTVVRFIHLPRDVLLLTIGQGQPFTVTSAVWFPDL